MPTHTKMHTCKHRHTDLRQKEKRPLPQLHCFDLEISHYCQQRHCQMKCALLLKAYVGLKKQLSCFPLAKENQELVGIYFTTISLWNSLPSLISHFSPCFFSSPLPLLLAMNKRWYHQAPPFLDHRKLGT